MRKKLGIATWIVVWLTTAVLLLRGDYFAGACGMVIVVALTDALVCTRKEEK